VNKSFELKPLLTILFAIANYYAVIITLCVCACMCECVCECVRVGGCVCACACKRVWACTRVRGGFFFPHSFSSPFHLLERETHTHSVASVPVSYYILHNLLQQV